MSRRDGLSEVAVLVRGAIETAIAEAETAGRSGAITALDAGCGRRSHLVPFRARIARLVGVDIHPPPAGALPHLDEFARVDVCTDPAAFPDGTFDLVLSSFTVEHFPDPAAAFRNLRRWLRPGGRLVISTVNRRHPLVAAYLDAPGGIRERLQPLVKATAADAHPLVGACNSVAELRTALTAAGFSDVHVATRGHLARAWGRSLPAFVLGSLGDLVVRPFPGRRSTIVASARA